MSSITNPFACKPCSVVVHKLTPEFLDDALNGRIKWKGLFRGRSHRGQFGTDTESFVRSKCVRYEKKKAEKEKLKEQAKHFYPEETDTGCSTEEDDIQQTPRQLRVRKPKKLFKCVECDFTTPDDETLLLHTASHKSTCDLCKLKFENKFKYQLHVYENHEPPVELKRNIVYGCKNCKHTFDEEIDAHNHLISHAEIIEGGKYGCTLCRSTYTKEVSLNAHLTTKHITYKCTFCDFLGSSFDTLERHSLNTHAAYGKPYPCNLCDVRTSTFGALLLHRKFNHAIEFDKNIERCRLCFLNLESDREYQLEHLISHVDICLITCNSCDYKCNSFQLMRNHGMDFHGLSDLGLFAELVNLNVLVKSVKAALDIQYGKAKKKIARTQPTYTETNMAIAGLNSSSFMALEPIDSPVKVVPMESSALNIQGVMADQDPFIGGYSVLHTPLDPMISFSSSAQDEDLQDPNIFPHPAINNRYQFQEFSSQPEQLNMGVQENPTEDQDYSDPQTSITVHPCDPLGIAYEQTVSHMPSQIPIPSEGILSVDPETGQLFLQGLPVFDEKGQAIYVAIHESAPINTEHDSPAKNIKDCVQTANEESTEPVPIADIA